MHAAAVGRTAVTPQALRTVARCLPACVTVVTSGQGAALHGMTVSSFTTLSLAPPLVSFSVMDGARIRSVVETSGGFTVNVLGAEQAALARWFASSERPTGAASFAGVELADEPVASGAVLAGALAYFACGPVRLVEAGDHVIAIGTVERCRTLRDGMPLIFEGGGFRHLGPVLEE
ncbi:flavin reductase family protein [Peterkaempfera bronchialis]|uniref:flavin reductase family protein n=1 Tax=Peterkaempfera bronchialis TaxID=2126346 RepID=UPI0013B4226E|nr:flavin reductase family protein [Peterkaempfera bronchialis]